MWSLCLSDVVSMVGTVASLTHCYWTMCVHSELGGVSAGISGCICGCERVICG